MKQRSHPQSMEEISKKSCLAVLAIVIYNAFDLSNMSAQLTQSAFWIVRPVAWSILFAALSLGVMQELRKAKGWHFAVACVQLGVARLYAPLVAAIVFSALVIGPLFSQLRLKLYFRDATFWGYWLNLLAVPRFSLPGLFDNSIEPQTVNANLWAVPFVGLLVLAAIASAALPRLGRLIPLLFAGALLVIEAVASSRSLRLFEGAGLVPGEGIGLPAAAMLAGLLAPALAETPLARHVGNVQRLLVLLFCGMIGALFSRGQSASLVVTAAIAIAAVLLVLPSGRARDSWRGLSSLLPVFLLFSYPLQQLLETHLAYSINAFVIVLVPLPVLILTTLLLSQPLARLGSEPGEVMVFRDAWAGLVYLNGGISLQRRMAVGIAMVLISVVMIGLYFALTLAMSPPKVGI